MLLDCREHGLLAEFGAKGVPRPQTAQLPVADCWIGLEAAGSGAAGATSSSPSR